MEIQKMTAVILAGGLGTRLLPLTLDLPKPLVEVAGKPFIDHLLTRLAAIGVKNILILAGYKSRMIQEHCQDGRSFGLKIRYSIEPQALGTGGALLHSLAEINEPVLVTNGDSYTEFDLPALLEFHKKKRAKITLLAMKGSLRDRGAVETDSEGKITHFVEKGIVGTGYFNTGTYVLEPSAVQELRKHIASGQLGHSFSMEKEGFPLFVMQHALYACKSKGLFYDMGTPAGLAALRSFLFK